MIVEMKRAILIVEDEGIVARDLQETLHGLGYDAFAIASSADEAILRATERCPDLVLMDVRIKGQLDGIETAEILKRRFGVAVLFLTAHADDATLARATAIEPHGYLMKPVKSAELRSAIEVSLYRHELEKRLHERDRQFATALESVSEAVVTVDLAGKITFMNAAAEEMTGMTAAETVGRSAREILWHIDEQVTAGEETPLVTALREKRAVVRQEASLVNPATGAQHFINDSATPVMDDGQALGAVMVFRDVTRQKTLQRQLELADRLASLGTMAAGVAHEINNPLSVISGNAEYLAEELTRYRAQIGDAAASTKAGGRLEDISAALADLQSAATRIGRIVSDLRAFSRPPDHTAGVANVSRCIDWAVRATSQEFRHRARLTTQMGDVPLANADESRLGQVFVNLLVNAAQSIAPGDTEHNSVAITTHTDELGRILVEVSDTGCGIPPEALGRIFDPFFTTKPAGVGTGLGLSICHGIVSSMGGELRAESEVGKGTKFVVVLPPAPAGRSETRVAVSETSRRLRGRVLIVDDEDTVRRTVERILRDHQVVCAASARDGLAMIDSGQRFDVIFVDMMMPTMTGMDFYETLLAQEPELASRIVFFSGGAISSKMDAFLRLVANPRIEKPFETASLLDAVQRILARIDTRDTLLEGTAASSGR
jgi:PAS domain S-box-containing protein